MCVYGIDFDGKWVVCNNLPEMPLFLFKQTYVTIKYSYIICLLWCVRVRRFIVCWAQKRGGPPPPTISQFSVVLPPSLSLNPSAE